MSTRAQSVTDTHRVFHDANLVLYEIVISTALTMVPLLGLYHAAAALVDEVDMSEGWQEGFKAVQFDGARKWVWIAIWVFTVLDILYGLLCLEQYHKFDQTQPSHTSRTKNTQAVTYGTLTLLCLYDTLATIIIAQHIHLFLSNALIAPSFCAFAEPHTSPKDPPQPRAGSTPTNQPPNTMRQKTQKDCKQINREILIFGAFSSIYAIVRALLHIFAFVSRLWAVLWLDYTLWVPRMGVREKTVEMKNCCVRKFRRGVDGVEVGMRRRVAGDGAGVV